MSPATLPKVNTDPCRFQKEGYCVFRHVLTKEVAAQARRVLDHDIAALTDNRPEYLTEPHVREPFWLDVCRNPRVLDIVESVLGPNLILIMSHLIVKRAGDGLKVEWHQDNTTWPGVDGTDVITVWLALDDADRENGCMEVIASSHTGYPDLEKIKTDGLDLLGLKVAVSPEMEAAAVPIELKIGDASIHDSFILHGSAPNLSSRRRAGYTMRYANAETTKVDVDKHHVAVYLMRGEAGTAGAKYIDVRPGR